MADLLDRQTVIDLFDKYHPYMSTRVLEYERKLKELPTIKAEPVRHGHYIKGGNGEWYCSECRRIDDKYSVAKYCWNCGAKMDEKTTRGTE